ncbi:MAG: glutamine synthetase family protein [Clostridia bacterium]
MSTNIQDIMSFIHENDVKFVRLAFCDPFGTHKNISIMSDELESAFTEGVCFDSSAINGFLDTNQPDLLLFPDPETLTILPWRPYPGRVVRFFCNIKYPDKTPFERDSRFILKQALDRAEKMGYACNVGFECEFYLFKTDIDGLPTKNTLDSGGYFDISPLDKGEDIRREICLYLEEMGLAPKSSRHNEGPGQNEIVIKATDGLTSADNFISFKSVVKSIAERNGLYASFMPKPILDNSGSGLHINISLEKDGKKIFEHVEDNGVAQGFIEGVLRKSPDMTLFLNPISNSYERLGEYAAPSTVSWSLLDRYQLIRVTPLKSKSEYMEFRSADPSSNPYICIALLINAGLDGIENKLELRPATDTHTNDEKLEKLPCSLEKAVKVAQESDFIKKYLDENFVNKYFSIKQKEVEEFSNAKDISEFYDKKYFMII